LKLGKPVTRLEQPSQAQTGYSQLKKDSYPSKRQLFQGENRCLKQRTAIPAEDYTSALPIQEQPLKAENSFSSQEHLLLAETVFLTDILTTVPGKKALPSI
jgi:hypothetical protein